MRPQSLVAEYEFKLLKPYTWQRHPYKFLVNLFNNGTSMVEQWSAEIDFPSIYIEGANQIEPFFHKKVSDLTFSPDQRRIWPGARLPVFEIDYVITNQNWPGKPSWPGPPVEPPKVKIRVRSANAAPWGIEIPSKEIQDF